MANVGRRTMSLHVVSVLLLSAYPLSLVLRDNLGIVPIPLAAVALILAVNAAVAGLLFVALRVVTPDVSGRAAWLAVFLLLFGLEVAVLQQVTAWGWPLRPDRPAVALSYAGVCAVIATLVARPTRVRRRDPIPMIILGSILFVANTAIGMSQIIQVPRAGREGWRPVAERFVARTADAPVQPPAPHRDVYYIVLDGFGSPDTLARLYGVQLSPLIGELAGRKFHIPSHPSSNYVQTYLSLASFLNLDYLDEIADAVGRDSSNRYPLTELIDRNALFHLAKRSGYEVTLVGSDYGATERITSADHCICEQFGSSSVAQGVLAATPALVHVFGPRFVDGHRRKVLSSFEALERLSPSGRPRLVLAHIVAPHPPFVFEPDGSRPDRVDSAWLQDGTAYAGTAAAYRNGYGRQVAFISSRLLRLVEVLLDRPGPAPVIVIHGDHGPGLRLHWNDATQTDMAERLGIFAAFHLPDTRRVPHDGITPVNVARLIANEYFGTQLPILEDRAAFSTWGRPYDFLAVSSTALPE